MTNTREFRVCGELTITSVSALREQLSHAMQECDTLCLNLEEVSRIDTAGLQWLMAVASVKQPRVMLRSLSEPVTRHLNLVNAAGLVPVIENDVSATTLP